MKLNIAISAGCWYCQAARKEDAMTSDCVFSLLNSYLIDRVLAGIILCQCFCLWRDFMQRKKTDRRKMPIRYVVERVYSGTEDMESLLTSVSEEAARRNVEEKLKNRKSA